MTIEQVVIVGLVLAVLVLLALLQLSANALSAEREKVEKWKKQADEWEKAAAMQAKQTDTAAAGARLLEAELRRMNEDAAVTRRMQPGVAVLADRLGDAEEALAELKGSYNRLRATYNAEASELADRIAEGRVADLTDRLLEYNRSLQTAAQRIAELEVRCGERVDDDSELD